MSDQLVQFERRGADVTSSDVTLSPLPPSYVSASWHCVLPVDADGRQGIGFNLEDGRVVRLAIDAETALALVTEIRAYRAGDPRFHSPISDGSPSRDGSPQDGQNV